MRFLDYFTDETMLYGGRYSPVLDHLGFLHFPAKQTAELLLQWYRTPPRNFTSELLSINGELKDNLWHIQPLNGDIIQNFLITQTSDPQWCMIVGNSFLGGGGSAKVGLLAPITGCEGLSVQLERPVKNPETNYGKRACCVFNYYPPNSSEQISAPCYVHVSDQGNHRVVWHFEHSKDYFEFEDIEGYKARVKTERFNPFKALEYCKYFGLDPFNEKFYIDEAYLVKTRMRTNTKPRTYSLSQIRERIGYHLLDEPES